MTALYSIHSLHLHLYRYLELDLEMTALYSIPDADMPRELSEPHVYDHL